MTRPILVLFATLALLACTIVREPPPQTAANAQPRSTGPSDAFPALETLQVMEARSAEGATPRPDVRVATTEASPVRELGRFETGVVVLRQQRRITLSGDEATSRGIEIDNFLLIEVLDDQSGAAFASGVVGFTAPVQVSGQGVRQVGDNARSFGPGAIDLTALFPLNRPFRLRVTALDYGEPGRVSDVFLSVK